MNGRLKAHRHLRTTQMSYPLNPSLGAAFLPLNRRRTFRKW